MITKVIKLDINKNLYNTLIAKQGDTKSRFLLFNLLDGSIPFSLENRSVRVYAVKPDRTEVFNDLIITDAAKGYCILELTTQMLAVAGTVKLELMVIEEDKKLTSNIFYMDVKESINSEKAVVSTNEFGALLTALSSLNEYDNYKKEIAAARDGEANLLTKVKKIDEQLDNKANISDIAKISSGTPSIVDSLSEMIDSTKNYVLKSTGEIYAWKNGVITPTNIIYQATAIQENSIDLLEISDNIRDTLTNKTKAELVSVENGFYTIDGTLRGDNDLRQKKYNVISGEVYEVFIRYGWQAVGVSFFNDNDEFIGYKYYTPNSSTGNTPVKRTIKIPSDATSMKITGMESSGLDNYYANKITLKEIKECDSSTSTVKSGKHVFMGDSLTDESTLGKGVKNYVNFVTERLGLTSVNIGMGGTGYLADNGKENPEYNFLKRKNLIPSDATSITIFGSFNDLFISNYTIGNVDDTNTTTMHGAFNTLIAEIYKINPAMKIGIISPTPWVGRNQRHVEEERRNSAINYVNFLEEACKYNSLPFLNLFYTSGVRTWDTDFNNRYTKGGDGVHPNSVGHETFIAPQVTAFVDSIL